MTSKQTILEKLITGVMALGCVMLFLFPRGVPGCLTLLILPAFFLPGYWAKFKVTVKKPITILFLSFFVLHAVSLLYTNNMDSGMLSMELKFSYLLIPLFLPPLFMSRPAIGSSTFRLLMLGALLAFAVAIGKGIYDFIQTGSFGEFFGAFFSEIVHPSYLAVYLIVLTNIMGIGLIRTGSQLTVKQRFWSWFLVLILTLFAILTMSKIGLVLLVVNALILSFYYAYTSGRYLKTSLVFLGFLGLTFTGIYFTPMKLRVEQMIHEIKTPMKSEKAYIMSTGMRLVTWEISSEVIAENTLTGVGVGDIRDELNRKYNEKGIVGLITRELDSHQQFLQTFATIGLSGFVNLVFIFLYLIVVAVRKRKLMLLSLTVFYLLFGLTESMFETQAGLVFFLLMVTLLLFVDERKLKLFNFTE